MKPPRDRRKCLNCKELFLPDYRSGQRQRYCLKPECRKVRKRELMRAWLVKPENQNYFRDAKNAERVRDWQKGIRGKAIWPLPWHTKPVWPVTPFCLRRPSTSSTP